MKHSIHIYPVLLLAFSVWLQYMEQTWFAVGVFVVSALCWLIAIGEIKSKNSSDEEL